MESEKFISDEVAVLCYWYWHPSVDLKGLEADDFQSRVCQITFKMFMNNLKHNQGVMIDKVQILNKILDNDKLAQLYSSQDNAILAYIFDKNYCMDTEAQFHNIVAGIINRKEKEMMQF